MFLPFILEIFYIENFDLHSKSTYLVFYIAIWTFFFINPTERVK